jgi:hypothetical protein
VQHCEGIYWCPAPLHDEDQRSYKVRDIADVQAVLAPPIDEYISDSMVGSDDEAPATSRRAPSKVAAPRRTRQTVGKISASRMTTQAAEVKKKRKQTRSAVSADTTTISSDIDTIYIYDEEGDIESPKATTAPSAGMPRRAPSLGKQAVETPCQESKTQEHPGSSIEPMGDLGSHKRAKKAPPKPCKPDLRSATE